MNFIRFSFEYLKFFITFKYVISIKMYQKSLFILTFITYQKHLNPINSMLYIRKFYFFSR